VNTSAHFRIDAIEIGRRTADTSIFLYLTEPGVPIEIAYRVWVLRNGSRTILVDTGPATQEGLERGLTQVTGVAAALARTGVDAAHIDTVLLTHLHWDHAANAEHFPDATFFAQRAELDFFNSAARRHPAFNRFYSANTDLATMIDAGRIRPLDGDVEFCPGIRVIRVGGHTPGSQMFCVDTQAGLAVIAGDAIPLCRNYRESIPSGIVCDVGEAIAALERVAQLAPVRIYPGHDTQASFAPPATFSTTNEF
jgi:glyoxylase-like metal-dependent hydrolase (beta-lactamase superfamily II)